MKLKVIPNEQTPELEPIEDIEQFITDNYDLMIKFMKFVRGRSDAAGLASNQLKINGVGRIMGRFCAIKHNHLWTLAIDPRIINTFGEKIKLIEGCLTWIGKDLLVERFPEVRVTYYDLKRELVTKRVTGFHAQVWQHEVDHLNGIEEVFTI